MKYTYIIIEDQKGALKNLKYSLRNKSKYYFGGFAANIKQGISLILEQQPDLIFLDVELGEENGFEILQELKNAFIEIPPIIITTAHNIYAKEAVNNQIIYFITKPICSIELEKALNIFEKKHAIQRKQLFIRNGQALKCVNLNDVVYLHAEDGYTCIHLSCGKKIAVPKTLKYFETQLNISFIRIHRAYIINVSKIKEIKLTEREIYLTNHQDCIKVEIGKNHVQRLRNYLKF